MGEGAAWIIIGIAICILAMKFGLGSFNEPGAGFIAFLSGLFLCGIGAALFLSKIFLRNETKQKLDAIHPFEAVPWRQLLYTIGLLLGYTLVFELLGYVLSTFLVMLGMSYDWGKKNLASSLLVSILTAFVSYLMFEVWLRCQLPRGIFPWW